MTPDADHPEMSRSDSNKARDTGRPSRWMVLLAMAASALVGFVAAHLLERPTAALASRGAGAPHTVTAPRTATAWMSMARRQSEPGSDRASDGALAQTLAGDTTLFRAIVDEYGRTDERPFRATLRELIVASARPDLPATGMELTRDVRGLRRGAGFELLARLRPSAETYAMAMRAVVEESDPTALAGALMALRSPGLPPNADARKLLPRFLELTQHPDPLVRGHAIQQLSDWDKTGDQATPIVLEALSDADQLVRQAAVGAVMVGGLRSNALKGALLRTATNPGEELTTRGSALHALGRFALTDAEQARYHAGQEELERFAMKHNEQRHSQQR